MPSPSKFPSALSIAATAARLTLIFRVAGSRQRQKSPKWTAAVKLAYKRYAQSRGQWAEVDREAIAA